MSEIGDAGDARFASLIDRILVLLNERDEVTSLIREVYAEAKGDGYDKTAMGALVTHLRKRARDAAGEDAKEEVFAAYLTAYERASRTHTHAREAA